METDEIGVIAPYNKQVDAVKSALEEDIDVATVHKFRGREKDAIIMTTVDDVITSFPTIQTCSMLLFRGLSHNSI